MSKLAFYLLLVLITLSLKVFGQENFENKVKIIARNIQKISKTEKENLKEELRILDEKLEKKEISSEQMEAEKKKIADKYATIISEKVTIEEEKLRKLVKDKAENSVVEIDYDTTLRVTKTIMFTTNKNSIKKNKEVKSEKRNTFSTVLAIGINNVLAKGEGLDNFAFKTWGSRFYEIGLTYNYRIIEDDNLLKFRVGLSAVVNNLRPKDNQYFVINDKQTNLNTFPIYLDDSRFRIEQLNIPLYLEFDFSPTKLNNEGKKIFNSHNGFKLGLGGYVGAILSNRQHLEFSENNIDNEVVERADFNTHDITYGLGAYFGYGKWSLYAKYDLQTVFKNNTQDINNISFGIRIN